MKKLKEKLYKFGEWAIGIDGKYGGWKIVFWLCLIFLPALFLSWIWGFIISILLLWLFILSIILRDKVH